MPGSDETPFLLSRRFKVKQTAPVNCASEPIRKDSGMIEYALLPSAPRNRGATVKERLSNWSSRVTSTPNLAFNATMASDT